MSLNEKKKLALKKKLPTHSEEKLSMTPQTAEAKNITETQDEIEANSFEMEAAMSEENFSSANETDGEQNSEGYFDDDEQDVCEVRDFSKNQIELNFSWSLMNQVRRMAKMEGISPEDLLTELVAEGVAKRVFEEQSRPAPSHLMTRTGYMHSDSEHNPPQPQLSHHSMNNIRSQHNNMQNRNRYNLQQKNSPQNRDANRGYGQGNMGGNNRSTANTNSNYRNQYNNNNQQRFSRNNNGYQSSNRNYDENSNTGQTGSSYNKRNYNKR